ncbi:MAG TPA: hypothetical protein VF522_23325 [Ramlibacter sp.]|uniref:hypothetical protein n=1 Tax=Ramlibacter sp. TaxID=1917967 RepID=UPI002ED1D5A3
MDFFHSLSLDLKMLVIGIAGFALLAIFSGNRRNEKRYVLALAVLAAVGVYRFTHFVGAEPAATAATDTPTVYVKANNKRAPLVSTSAR